MDNIKKAIMNITQPMRVYFRSVGNGPVMKDGIPLALIREWSLCPYVRGIEPAFQCVCTLIDADLLVSYDSNVYTITDVATLLTFDL